MAGSQTTDNRRLHTCLAESEVRKPARRGWIAKIIVTYSLAIPRSEKGKRLPMGRYALELDLAGCAVVVVGLGRVGRRKALGLIEAGARVVGVDPQTNLGPISGVDRLIEPFRPSHLDGVELVFAAATPEVNRVVVTESKARGIWVNSASEPPQGNFTIPAVIRLGLVSLTVSTSGAGPALASNLCALAVRSLGPEAEILAGLLAEIRPEVLARVSDPSTRRRLFLRQSDLTRLEHLQVEGIEAVRAVLRAELDRACREPGFPEGRD